MSKLHISPELSLPKEAVTQTFAILAKRGVGKTYTASVIAEEMLKASLQVVIVDPIGVWWGLRAAADGKQEGLEIIVMGGEHGDVPLEPTGGELVADFIVEHGRSVVVDLSSFRKGESIRFMTAFAETLYRRNRAPLHLIVDEADAFAPQKTMRGEGAERLLGAMEDIVRRGRARGLGVTLVTQRAAVLNKNVLTQTEVLVCLRTISPQDRDAVEAWVHAHDFTTEQWQAFVNSLPTLPVGTAWFWSPGWLNIFKKIKVRKRETFDSSATPKVGEKIAAPKHLKPVDLETLKQKMAAPIEQAKANDPKELRAQIARLKSELAKKPAPAKAESKPDQKQTIRAAELSKAQRSLEAAMKFIVEITTRNFDASLPEAEVRKAIDSAVRAALKQLRATIERRGRDFDELKKKAGQILRAMKQIIEADVRRRWLCCRRALHDQLGRPVRLAIADYVEADVPVKVEVRHNEPFSVSPPARPRPQSRSSNGAGSDVSLGVGERRCGIAIAQHGSVTREQLTVLTGYKRSTRNTYVQRMRAADLVEEQGDRIHSTDALIEFLGGDYEPLPTGEDLRKYWFNKLPEGESAVFRCVVEDQSNGISREQIGELTGYKRSTRNTYIQRLAARELVVANGEIVRPSETLFDS